MGGGKGGVVRTIAAGLYPSPPFSSRQHTRCPHHPVTVAGSMAKRATAWRGKRGRALRHTSRTSSPRPSSPGLPDCYSSFLTRTKLKRKKSGRSTPAVCTHPLHPVGGSRHEPWQALRVTARRCLTARRCDGYAGSPRADGRVHNHHRPGNAGGGGSRGVPPRPPLFQKRLELYRYNCHPLLRADHGRQAAPSRGGGGGRPTATPAVAAAAAASATAGAPAAATAAGIIAAAPSAASADMAGRLNDPRVGDSSRGGGGSEARGRAALAADEDSDDGGSIGGRRMWMAVALPGEEGWRERRRIRDHDWHRGGGGKRGEGGRGSSRYRGGSGRKGV